MVIVILTMTVGIFREAEKRCVKLPKSNRVVENPEAGKVFSALSNNPEPFLEDTKTCLKLLLFIEKYVQKPEHVELKLFYIEFVLQVFLIPVKQQLLFTRF